MPSPLRIAALGWALLGSGCGAQSPGGPTSAETSPSGAPPTPADGAPPIDPTRSTWTPIGESSTVTLPTKIERIAGSDDLLFVSQPGDRAVAFARRLDAESGELDPVVTLNGERVVRAFADTGERFTLVTSTGTAICAGSVAHETAALGPRSCAQRRADVVVAVGDRLALLSVGPPIEDEEERKRKATLGKTRPPAKKPPPGPKKKPKGPPEPVVQEIALWWMSRTGELDDEGPVSTELEFERPLTGMDLIDAHGRGDGIDVLLYEAADEDDVTLAIEKRKKKLKGKPYEKRRGSLGFARIGAARLDADGKLVEGSRSKVVVGDLHYGYLAEHREPRLLGNRRGSVYVGLQWLRGACIARRTHPTLGPTAVDRPTCAVDPMRFAVLQGVDADERADYEKLEALKPTRAYGQPAYDPDRVRWVGERAYFLRGDALHSSLVDASELREEPHPFAASRAPVVWASLDARGHGVAVVGERALSRAPGGAISPLSTSALPPEARSAELADVGSRAAKIGDRWWMAAFDVFPLGGAAPEGLRARGHPDTTEIVGGNERGLLLEWQAGQLRVTGLTESGATTELSSSPSPVRVGFAAVERPGGGAIVAGHATTSGRVVSFVVDAEGRLSGPSSTTLPSAPGVLGVRLVPQPGGGALLMDEARQHVVWLDQQGREAAQRPWPSSRANAACMEGRPGRSPVPGIEPGSMVDVPELLQPGVCVVGDVVWGPGGTLQWFGHRAEGPRARAESVVVRFGGDGAANAAAAAPPFAPQAASAAPKPGPFPCPPEMVDVAGAFCIDRFEARLFDADSHRWLSPDYPSTPKLRAITFGRWATQGARVGDAHARATWLPFLEAWQHGADPRQVARSRLGARPSGYVTGLVAKSACAAAGKRLCTLREFRRACRGEDDTLYPYGERYEHGRCNVFRPEHPAAMLHGHASVGHLDPRLNRTTAAGKPLLRLTGATPACRSRWGDDAIYDMVGNLDEWVDEKGGAFAGGFYARSTRAGCEASIESHPMHYLDYSTGIRCCGDPQ